MLRRIHYTGGEIACGGSGACIVSIMYLEFSILLCLSGNLRRIPSSGVQIREEGSWSFSLFLFFSQNRSWQLLVYHDLTKY